MTPSLFMATSRPQTDGQHTATTATALLDRLDRIVLTDGTEIQRSAIRGLAVSHFQTCPASSFFSKGNHRRNHR